MSKNNALVSEVTLIEAFSDKLIHEVECIFKEKDHLTDEILFALQYIFQAPLLPALDLVDNRAVTMVTSPSGRKLYQVTGSSGKPYFCFMNSKYCSCPAYRYSVLLKEDHIMCKHILALQLSDAVGLTKKIDISDQEMTNMIMQMD